MSERSSEKRFKKSVEPENLVRRATHAGSWYSNSDSVLELQLGQFLSEAGQKENDPARIIIAPHAGYQYSGECAAFAYKELDSSKIKRIFLIGPSHHVSIPYLALSIAKTYKTPLGDIQVDTELVQQFLKTSPFKKMSIKMDEDEHSLELHLPYIKKIMKKNDFTVVPILVGSLTNKIENEFAEVMLKYILDDSNLFIISSDFCHWGYRFNYTFYEKSWGDYCDSIEQLDRLGVDAIESLKTTPFKSYLNKYGNTICGRYPIILMLSMLEKLQEKHPEYEIEFKFLKYAQSSKCRSIKDSSVSYVAAALTIIKNEEESEKK